MIQRIAAYATALATLAGMAWAGVTYALDGRYVDAGELASAVESIRRDRVEADLRDAEMRLALATMQQAYADGEWIERRERERQIIEQEIARLERELGRD